MSLDRQDVRCRLDADKHAALVAICNARGLTVAEFVEALLLPENEGPDPMPSVHTSPLAVLHNAEPS